MEQNRRDVLKTVGVAASGLTLAGCLGSSSGSDDTNNDAGDETVTPGDPGWFDIDTNIFEERMGQELEVTESSLFRTANNFGVRFTVANRRGAPLTSLTVHVELVGTNNEVLGSYESSLPEAESIDDLATNETWSGDVIFENTKPDAFFNSVVAYRIWTTAEAEGSAPPNSSSNNSTTENVTLQDDAANSTSNEPMNSTAVANNASTSTEKK